MREMEERLNKYLSQCAGCSRREADRLIEEGRVEVNGVRAVSGMKVAGSDQIRLNGKPIMMKQEKMIVAFYKPVGVTCSEKDEHAKKLVTDCLDLPVRLTYAGRLDKDSEGLLIMTNDGQLIQQMMRGANGHEKEYLVTLDHKINKSDLARWAEGIYLKDLDTTTRPCKVKQISGETMGMILTQGLNRQIRRMVQTLGYEVVSLKRIRVMNIELGSLKPGEYRVLEREELKELYRRCGM